MRTIGAAVASMVFLATGCQKHPAESRPPLSDIEWTGVSDIYHMTSRATDLRREEEWKRLKGRRVHWSGDVWEVADEWSGVTLDVQMNSGSIAPDVRVHLNSSQKEEAARLSKGERVTFEGTLGSWSRVPAVTLEDAEIVSE